MAMTEESSRVRQWPHNFVRMTEGSAILDLVGGVVQNSLDRALVGECTRVDIHLSADNSIVIRDDGPGIAVEAEINGLPALEKYCRELWDEEFFQRISRKRLIPNTYCRSSRPPGLSVLAALSNSLVFDIYRGGAHYQQRFSKGEIFSPLLMLGPTQKTGTSVRFRADSQIIENTRVPLDRLLLWLRAQAALTGVAITVNDEVTQSSHQLYYPQGVVSYFEEFVASTPPLNPYVEPLYLKIDRPEVFLEIALAWRDTDNGNVFGHLNGSSEARLGAHIEGLEDVFDRALQDVVSADLRSAAALGWWNWGPGLFSLFFVGLDNSARNVDTGQLICPDGARRLIYETLLVPIRDYLRQHRTLVDFMLKSV